MPRQAQEDRSITDGIDHGEQCGKRYRKYLDEIDWIHRFTPPVSSLLRQLHRSELEGQLLDGAEGRTSPGHSTCGVTANPTRSGWHSPASEYRRESVPADRARWSPG